ncbi:MAG: hypothetical protein RL660_287 [Bacteroidota bacterium]|jgi:four helix bundle protein
MFDFEKLDVYSEIKQLNKEVLGFIYGSLKDDYLRDQWKRATMSIMLNLAEGTGRMSSSEKKHFYTISRSSVFECIAIMDVLVSLSWLDSAKYDTYYKSYEKVSKMLLGLYRNVA